jgi:Leucine-rich repeat (LRR) protein
MAPEETMGDLRAAEQRLTEHLADLLERTPDVVFEALQLPPEDPGQVATTIEDGRFTRLSLRVLGRRLRWAQPLGDLTVDLSGLDALRELDVSGLQLTHLDLAPCPRLERLELTENALRQLDLSANPALRVLDLSANEVMVLDLSNQRDLWFLDATGNELSTLVVPDGHALKVVRCARNQLMVLDLGPSPRLAELNAGRNALVSLTLDAPRLRVLDVQDNQLDTLDLSSSPTLRRLTVRRNRLASLDLAGLVELRTLDASRNYLDHLDVTPCTAMETLDVARNQLVRLDLGPCPALATLDAHSNRLESLALDEAPSLQRLDVAHNGLRRLDVSAARTLCELVAAHNRIEALDLRGLACLARADVHDNPLARLALDGSPALAEVTVSGDPEVTGDETPAGPVRHTTALPDRDLRTLDRFEAHRFAAQYDEPDREAVLLDLVQDPERCALGTAVMIYWMTSPHWFAQFDERDDVPVYAVAGWDLVRAIEARVRDGAYPHDDVFFDPRHDQQTVDVLGKDWTRGPTDSRDRVPPAFMTHPRGAAR